MKKFLIGIFSVAILSSVNIGLAHASVNDFVIRDFQADYYLDKDSEGRSTLKTVELITAEFPNFDQNHGIERAIPTKYDGHSVSLKIDSVTDQNGLVLPYSTYASNDNSVLRIGDADTYVQGTNTYKITYFQRDVTKFFADTNDDEFYWDTNGTEWAQPFYDVTARLHIDPSILGSLNDKKSCYYGLANESKSCTITRTNDIFTASASSLNAGQNVTISVGFSPHTFSGYQMTAEESMQLLLWTIYAIMAVISSVATVILLIIMFRLKATKGKGALGRGTIVPEYLPPKSADIALSSVILANEKAWTAAMYVDLAVRHNLKIIERKEGLFKKTAYSLEFISGNGLTSTENEVVEALFGSNPQAGAKHDFPLRTFDSELSMTLRMIYKKAQLSAKADGYYADDKKLRKTLIIMTVAIVIMTFFTTVIGFIAIFVAVYIVSSTKPLSEKGRELHDYLKGLELYIKVAEEERIKVLQSPQGAEKTPIDINDKTSLVHLYEKVLSYAVLFGNEKEWAKVLGKFYEQQNSAPDWYVGNNVFNAVMFSSALSGFSSNTVSNSYSSPSSSSSGGSGGGGFSGGGGGGGGGGGW